jgi:hypothetical protein
MKEFGRIYKVSKQFHDAMAEESLKLINNILERDFDEQKKEHFPNWEGTYILEKGPGVVDHVLTRTDGEDVSEEVMDKYFEYLYEDGPEFEFGDEYYLKEYESYQFGWYAAVPDESVIAK